jgi:hypothetical protein
VILAALGIKPGINPHHNTARQSDRPGG